MGGLDAIAGAEQKSISFQEFTSATLEDGATFTSAISFHFIRAYIFKNETIYSETVEAGDRFQLDLQHADETKEFCVFAYQISSADYAEDVGGMRGVKVGVLRANAQNLTEQLEFPLIHRLL